MKTAAVTKLGSLKELDPAKRGQLEILDFPEKSPDSEEVKIKVAYCAVCGSEPHIFEGNYFAGIQLPRGIGHEVSGIVAEVGEKATRKGLKVGDRVAANFLCFCGICEYCMSGKQQFCPHRRDYMRPGMAEYVTWHEQQIYKLPDDVSLKEGCLLEPTAICVRMVDKMAPKIGQTALVCGGGPIGLMTIQMLNLCGVTSLTIIEPIEKRRALAKTFGAQHAIDPLSQDVEAEVSRITGGKGFDCVLDASGALPMMSKLPELAAMGGTIVYGAMYPLSYEMPLNLSSYLYTKELTITGVYVAPYVFPRAINTLSRLNLDDFTSKVYPLEQAYDALLMNITGEYTKILVQCNSGLE